MKLHILTIGMGLKAFSNCSHSWAPQFLSRERKYARPNAPQDGKELPRDSGVQSTGSEEGSDRMEEPPRPCHHPTHQHTDRLPMMRWGFWYLKYSMTSGHEMISTKSLPATPQSLAGRAGQGALVVESSQEVGIPLPPHC